VTTLKERLKDHEGFRAEMYRCPAGFWTIGYGHYLGSGQCTISPQIADLLLDEDIHKATFEFLSIGWNLGQTRNDVMIEMIFWHGLKGFLKFKKMITAVEREDWSEAASQMMDSNSGRDYKARMTELAMLMVEG